MIKAVLALHYKVFAPHAWVENPLPLLQDASSPVYMRKEPAPWVRHPSHPRRAAVSAFGFGGTNFHAVLEEILARRKPGALGSQNWPRELFARKSATGKPLLAELTEFQRKVLRDKTRELASPRCRKAGPAALCLTAASQELATGLESAIGASKSPGQLTLPISSSNRGNEG
jgi:acyl transferase domain-containing protein